MSDVVVPVTPVVEVPVAPAPEAPAAAAVPVKKTVHYQVTDENGHPIGNPTHIEYTTEAELIEKMQTAHTHATRAFHRLKAQKTTFRTEQPKTGMSDQEILAEAAKIKSENPAEAAAAIRKITGYDELQEEREKARQARIAADQEKESLKFMRSHVEDFHPCEANAKIIGKYLEDNNLEWTSDNLEVAFVAVESQLAPVPGKPVPEPVQEVIPAVTVPVVETPAAPAAPAPAAVNPAPAAPPAPVVTEPVPAPQPTLALPNVKVVDSARVRGVNTGGIKPGELSGKQPVVKTETVTIEQIAKWKQTGELRKKMQNPAIRAQIELRLAERNASKTGRTS